MSEETTVYDGVPGSCRVDISAIPEGVRVVSGFVGAVKPGA
jgi:hypothetical protein